MKTVEQVLLKKPFTRAMPSMSWVPPLTNGADSLVQVPSVMYQSVSQSQFMAEYDPNGHKINDPFYYANRLKTDETTGMSYVQYVERCSLPFQAVITTKQLTHLSGNNIRFVNASPSSTEDQKELMVEFKNGWIEKNMEVALFESYKMEKITGDAAMCGYMDNGVFGWRTFGFKNNEILYPQYDNRTGKLNQFGRKYDQMVDDGKSETIVEVWDSEYISTYKRSTGVEKFIRSVLGSSGWSVVSRERHGFPFIPIAYKRSDTGACWSLVQDCIDKYEIAVSQLCENNKHYAFRIMFVSGEEVDMLGIDASGQPSVITGDKDSKAGFLEKADASTSFELQLKILKDNIFTGSFTVLPPEVKGGDLPGVTIKILYSPAVEKAMEDAMEWNSFVDDTVKIFKFGYSIEQKKAAEYDSLKVRGSIVPYVHQNDAEITANLNSSVTMGTLSKETAAEMNVYAKSDEYKRIQKETEADQQIQLKADAAKLNSNNQAREDAEI